MGEKNAFAGRIASTFGFEFDNTLVTELKEVSPITIGNELVEVKQTTGDGKYVNTFVPGRPRSGEVTIKRLLTDSTLADWMATTNLRKSADARRDGSIIAYDEDGEIYRYVLTGCVAKEHSSPGFEAGDNSVGLESLTFAYETAAVQYK